MKRNAMLLYLVLMFLFIGNASANGGGYSSILLPVGDSNTIIFWNVIDSPEAAVAWGWTGEGSWFVETGDKINFTVTRVEKDFVTGILGIGNFSMEANNSRIASEIVYGVWGLTPFFPGLIIKIGEENLDTLNDTAYASAARVLGNYLNGTMISSYGSVIANGRSYNCIIFEYEQDPTGFGEPQVTYLAYDTETGVLVKGNSSYYFGEPWLPYLLAIELESITPPGLDMTIILLGAGTAAAVVLIIIVGILKKK
jgi:hypothetical protein